MYVEQVLEHQGKLKGYLTSLHPHSHEVDDILQETNITLINKEKDFDPNRAFLPWAFTIAKFTWMAYRQKRARQRKYVSEHEWLDQIQDPSLREQLAYEIEVERLALLKKVIPCLTPRRQAMLQELLEGKKIHQIAKDWGEKQGTLSALKRATLQSLKKHISRLKMQISYECEENKQAEKRKADK